MLDNEHNFEDCFKTSDVILMEGALAERLKREYNMEINKDVALASYIYNNKSREALKELFAQYINIAKLYNLPIMITTPTRRANKERVKNSNYNESIINDNVSFLKEIRSGFENEIYIGGLMGCKGDAYKAEEALSEEEAFIFHSWQANLFKEADVDFLYAGIMPALSEAIGMAKAMERTGLPYIISFMIRDDGRLLDGTTINDAIEIIDKEVCRQPICYVTNCVHPEVVYEALSKTFNKTDIVKERFKGIQANTANLSPEKLNNSRELICSEVTDLADSMMKLYEDFDFKIFGGCCGTNERYMNEIAKRLATI